MTYYSTNFFSASKSCLDVEIGEPIHAEEIDKLRRFISIEASEEESSKDPQDGSFNADILTVKHIEATTKACLSCGYRASLSWPSVLSRE